MITVVSPDLALPEVGAVLGLLSYVSQSVSVLPILCLVGLMSLFTNQVLNEKMKRKIMPQP